MSKFSLILLAGGKGTRMNSSFPKQFLKLKGKEIALYSFDFFKIFKNLLEIIVVCEPCYEYHFKKERGDTFELKFALPGRRRQDSLFNGLKLASNESELIAIHDSARPLLNRESIEKLLEEASIHGAATLSSPIKFTVKEQNFQGFIKKTLKREDLFEIQTPQIIHHKLLKEGFKYANANDLEVTDDVSLVELIQKPVKLVKGCSKNIKITTPEDLAFVEFLMEKANGPS